MARLFDGGADRAGASSSAAVSIFLKASRDVFLRLFPALLRVFLFSSGAFWLVLISSLLWNGSQTQQRRRA